LESIVGVQTDKPFKRSMQPFGGIRMAKAACEAYGYDLNSETEKIFTDYRKTHNQGVFNAYSKEMLNCRKAGIITGLPDAYGRGRIIGDYRRIALYGVDFLMQKKMEDFNNMSKEMSEDVIRLREELSEQYRALN
ncbi:formate acetyltransferase, partial [Mesorhizobium sp. M8A.F.Ca.ET.173.01.1.1]